LGSNLPAAQQRGVKSTFTNPVPTKIANKGTNTSVQQPPNMSCRRFCGKENVCIVTAKNVCKSQFEPNRRRSLDNQKANGQGLWHRYQNLSAPGQKSRCQGPLADM